jgi:hypothetical protein
MRVLTTIAKKKRTVITVILLDKLRFEKQKFRPRCLHQGRTKAGAELAMTGSADENPIHRSGSAHFFTRSLSRPPSPAPLAEQKVNFCLTAYAVSGIYGYSGIRVTGAASPVLPPCLRSPPSRRPRPNAWWIRNRIGDGTTAGGEGSARALGRSRPQCVLSQRTVLTSEPVPTLRPTTSNTPIAFDVMPNGAPGSTSIAWVDISDADCYASTAPVNFLHLAANSTALQIASSSLYGGTGKPLTFLYGSMEIFRLNSVRLGVGVGGNAFASPFIVSTNAAALPAGVGEPARAIRLRRWRRATRADRWVGNNPVLDLRAANGTAASPSALTSGTTIGQVNFDGYNGSASTSGPR